MYGLRAADGQLNHSSSGSSLTSQVVFEMYLSFNLFQAYNTQVAQHSPEKELEPEPVHVRCRSPCHPMTPATLCDNLRTPHAVRPGQPARVRC